MGAEKLRARLESNAFLVLGLALSATRAEVERNARRILDELELGRAGADNYGTPWGPQPRDAYLVREARQCLRDPKRRAAEELWLSAFREVPARP